MRDYKALFSRTVSKGKTFLIAHDPEEAKPWRVTYLGNGHYFRSLEAALAYCYGRGWIQSGEFSTLEAGLSKIAIAQIV